MTDVTNAQIPADNLPAPAAGSVRDLLRMEDVKERFREVLRDRAPQFIASLSSVVYQNKALRQCQPWSVIAAALKAAALTLPIDQNIGHAAIVPYKDTATFQVQWKGYIQLALRTNQYANIHVTEVYDGMVKGVDPFTGEIIKGKRTGDKVIGYYAYFRLLNGFEKSLYMTVEEVLEHGKKYSKTFHKSESTWQKDPDSMGRKTVLKRLITRYGILSVEMQKAIRAEAMPDEGETDAGADQPGENAPDWTDPAVVEASMKADREALFPPDEGQL